MLMLWQCCDTDTAGTPMPLWVGFWTAAWVGSNPKCDGSAWSNHELHSSRANTHETLAPKTLKLRHQKGFLCFLADSKSIQVSRAEQFATSLTAMETWHMGSHVLFAHLHGKLVTQERWHSCLYPSKAGTQFSDTGGMKAWVDLVGWLHTEMVCLPILREKTIKIFQGGPSPEPFSRPTSHLHLNTLRSYSFLLCI